MTTSAHLQRHGKGHTHRRKAHNKSRRGCRNCKLRSIKCDEVRPSCNKCTNSNYVCNFNLNTPDLQMSFDGAAVIKTPPKPPCSGSQGPASVAIFQIDKQNRDRLGRFQMRTVLSVGSPGTARLMQSSIVELAYAHPYLMAGVQTLTAIHDRYLSPSPSLLQTTTVLHHLSRAAALFNEKLSRPIEPAERDVLWATNLVVATAVFAWIEASTPEEVWPLTHSEISGPQWLIMSECKAALWNITNPLRSDSIFYTLADEYRADCLASTATRSGIEGIPPRFVQLYSLDNRSTPENSPYYAAIQALAQLLPLECSQSTLLKFLGFTCHLQRKFRTLLEQKDARALLLFAYWYAKVCHSLWWLRQRALLECQATCLYLERYHADDTAIQQLLRFPKMQCGLVA